MVQAFSALAAALTSQQARQPDYADFLRLIYANLNPPPTTLGGPNAYRVFFGATSFYQPPITVSQVADFSGIPVNPTLPLFVLRCQPPAGSPAAPLLATWPNVIPAMLADYQARGVTPGTPDEAIMGLAQEFDDFSSTVVDEPLANALDIGRQFFESYPASTPNPQWTAAQMQAQMSKRFGTFTAFSGVGYAVEGTASGPALNAAQASMQMMVPEYVLKNVTLAQAGCSCIQVPPYNNRDSDLLNPDYVSQVAGVGSCVTVPNLGPAA